MSTTKEQAFAYFKQNGIPIVSPDNPCWDQIPVVLMDVIKEKDPKDKWKLSTVARMNVAAGPIVATIYNEAILKNIKLSSIIPGEVIHHPSVLQALEDYIIEGNRHSNFDDVIEVVLTALFDARPLRPKFCKKLQAQYYFLGGDKDMRAWIAPHVGGIPPFKTWNELCGHIVASYPLIEDDRDLKSPRYIQKQGPTHHWSTNVQRMELVLASWLHELNDNKKTTGYNEQANNIYMALYTHLPAIKMDEPDELTAVFWSYLHEYIKEPSLNVKLKSLIEEWMTAYPEYHIFVQKHYSIVESVVQGDNLIVGHHLHNLYQDLHPQPSHIHTPNEMSKTSIVIRDALENTTLQSNLFGS